MPPIRILIGDRSERLQAVARSAIAGQPDLVTIEVITPIQFRFLLLDLHARERRYDPAHPESYHFDLDPDTGKLVHQPHDPDYKLHRLNAPPERPNDGTDTMAGVHWKDEFLRTDPENAPELVKKTVRLFTETLKMFAEEAGKEGIELALFYGCDFGSTYDRKWTADGVEYDSAQFPALLRRIADEAGVRFIDGMKLVKENCVDKDGDNLHHTRLNGHWSPAGHAFIGRGLAEEAIRIQAEKAKLAARLE